MLLHISNRIFRSVILIMFLTVLALSACSGIEAISSQPSPDSPTTIESDQISVFNGESDLIVIEEIVIGLLLIAAIVGIITRRLRVPYTVGLVLIGLALSLRGQAEIDLPPELFLALLVPPLVFEAAFHLNVHDLKNDLAPIMALAIPGVLITTGLVGLVVAVGTGFPLSLALVFGALVAATDPVAVVALFRSMGVPKRLQVLLEGESLFNDGTAIVVFNLMITIAITGNFSIVDSVLDFVVVSGGGLVIGLLLGIIFSQIIGRIDDSLIETTLTGVLAFGAYLVAEQIHVSGVLAVVAAGLIAGNIGPRGMSASTRILVFNFWEIAAFLANSMVFLLIGLQIDLRILILNWPIILIAIVAVLVARAVGAYGLSWVGRGMPKQYKHVLFWGGLRGAISLALAISLPVKLGSIRGEIQAMAFGVVLFTLLVQGLTMRPLIHKLKLIQSSERQEEYKRRHARAVMSKTAYERLEAMYDNGLLSVHVWESLEPILKEHTENTARVVRTLMHEDPTVELEEYDTARREVLQTQRSTLSSLLRDGIISEEIFSQLAAEVDQAITETQTNWLETTHNLKQKAITGLMAAVLQEQDLDRVIDALEYIDVPVVRMPSAGEFLGHRNITILIGIPNGQEENILQTLQQSSQRRIETVQPGERLSEDKQEHTEITIGATIFSFDVERYEEF